MGKKLIIPGADFSASGIRTSNVVDVVLNNGGNIDFYFLPTSMSYNQEVNTYPTPPIDAIKNSVSLDSQVGIDGTFASFLFGSVSVNDGLVNPSGVKKLSVNYDKVVKNMQKSFMSLVCDTLDLRGMKFSDDIEFTDTFAHANIKDLKMPDLYVAGLRHTFYNFMSTEPNVYHVDFTFIKKVANDLTGAFTYLKAKTANFTGIDVSEATIFNSVFRYCRMTEIDLSSWQVNSANWAATMFDGCPNLRTIHLDNWNSTISMSARYNNMFANTPSLEKVFVTNCTSTVKTWLLERLNEVSAGGSNTWSESSVDGKACLIHS